VVPLTVTLSVPAGSDFCKLRGELNCGIFPGLPVTINLTQNFSLVWFPAPSHKQLFSTARLVVQKNWAELLESAVSVADVRQATL